MRTLPRAGSRSLVVTALLAALPAQDAGQVVRRSTFALVLDAQGAPLPGASVTFAGCVPHVGPESGPCDLQTVAADARGRAHAKLRADLCYVAWAVGPPAADREACPISHVESRFAAGAMLELRCARTISPRYLRVSGAEAWNARGPLRFFAVTRVPGSVVELENAGGRIGVPPGPEADVEVCTADGQVLWSTQVRGENLVIPPPQQVRVRVVDENGAPLAGAIVQQRVARRPPWPHDSLGAVAVDVFRALGSTADDGTLIAEVCHPVDPLQDASRGDLMLFASAPGRATVAGGVLEDAFYVDDRKVVRPPSPQLVLTCKPVEPLAGQWSAAPRGSVAHLTAVCKLHVGNSGYMHDSRAFVATVGEGGNFMFEGVPGDVHSVRLTLLLPEGEPRQPPLLPALAGRCLPEATSAPVIPVCDLALQALDPTGGPARGAVAFVVPGDLDGVLVRDAAACIPLDARGAAAVRLLPGRWGFLVATVDGWAATALGLEEGEHALKLEMQPLARMHLLLRDAAGDPIAGARVLRRGSSTRGTQDPVHSMLQSLHQGGAARWEALRTDRDGRVQVPFLPAPGLRLRILLRWDGGETDVFGLEANESALELRPR